MPLFRRRRPEVSRLRDGKAISLWAAYFEPQAVLKKLGIKLAVAE